MADRWAFIVAVEKPLHPEGGAAPYAEAGARALADALAGAGTPKANQVVLLGQYATKAAVASRLRRLRDGLADGDAVLAYFAGRAEGDSLLLWDTLPDDVPGTGLSLGELVAVGRGRPAAFLFDTTGGPAATDLADLFDESPAAVALTAADPDEVAYASAGLKAPAWTHLVTEAVAGRAAKAADADGRVTAATLHRYVADELPRVLRKHLEPGAEQTPRLYGGNGAVVLAEVPRGGPAAAGLLDPGRLRRVVFRSDSHGRIKDLSGFRKTFTVPDDAGPRNRKFVAKLATADLKADLDGVFAAARDHLGYKRKDIEVNVEDDGSGFLRGPDFEYTVTVTIDVEDPSQVRWRREVGGFADAGFVRTAGFDAVFGKLFDQLAFEFQAPVDVAALVDRLEDAPPKGLKVRVAADGRECDVALAGFAGRVTVGRSSLTVRGRAGDSAGLLDQLLRFLGAVGPVGEPLALPGG